MAKRTVPERERLFAHQMPFYQGTSPLAFINTQNRGSPSIQQSNKKKNKKDEIALSMAIECECAESWTETNKQVIKVLMNAERRLQKGFPRELLQLPHWTESPGATAVWMYNLIFDKVPSVHLDEHCPAARGARVKTIRTIDVNGTASESEQDDDIGSISPELEIKLDQSPVRSQVINELLERWTGLSFQEVRRIVETNDKGRSRLQDTARRFVKWYWKNEKSSDDGSSPPTRTRSKGRRYEDGRNSSTIPFSKTTNTDKSIRKSSESDQLAEEMGEDWGTIIGGTSRKRQKGKHVVGEEQVSVRDTSKAFVFGESRMPSVAALEKQKAIGSASRLDDNSIQNPGATSSILGQFGGDEPNPWIESNLELGQSSKDAEISVEEISELDLNTITVKGKAPAPVTLGGQKVRINVLPVAQQGPQKKSTLSKASTSDSNGRRS
ncbi:hypothetical protein P171DRAFT_444988 [Karstenula rhodostoma CBS 690.94]|uniref:Uncharacterized protein n=1 Tax=Karstenula rhodostoma CBS 690.94 TaxID=1392251 RepID=A0A9P4PIJ5_9PLEO|nr:hypothetical protein P171DRAFT_444988 [Karstenula rhodostoma CBS 690.94]